MTRFTAGTKVITSEDKQLRIETKEGQIAYVEAIEFLRAQKPLKPFKWSD
jgi:transcription elongation factor